MSSVLDLNTQAVFLRNLQSSGQSVESLTAPTSACLVPSDQSLQTSLMNKIANVAWKFWNCTKSIASFVVPHNIIRSVLTGSAVGVSGVYLQFSIYDLISKYNLISKIGSASIGVNLKRAEQYTKIVSKMSVISTIANVAIEEIAFRETLPAAIEVLVQRFMRKKSIPFHCESKLIRLTGVVASSILFGVAHLDNGLGLSKTIAATSLGLLYGLLKEKEGVLSATVAHTVNNLVPAHQLLKTWTQFKGLLS